MSNKKVKSPSASKNLEAIYPLSPMQQGMLFHSLYAPKSGVYVEQMTLMLQGDINVTTFKSAWQKVVDRYSILRTFFIWENRPTPLQVVLKQVDLPWTNLDWRSLSSTNQQQQLSELLQTQREQGFQLDQAPLMGCTLIRFGEDVYKFIWNCHHILMDGWCLPIIFKEVLSLYEAELQGKTYHLSTPTPYRGYIAWLNAQDQTASTEFWRQALQGFSAPTPLVVDRTPPQSQQPDSNYQELELQLSTDVSRKLLALAQQQHVTLSTLVQAAWGLLLSRYSGEPDIVFGVTVSGRPTSLSGVENMVGLFINTLPLRLQISPNQQLIPWLAQIQQFMLELQQYSYTPLVEIQSLSEVPGGTPLFESIVVFENYPMDSSLANKSGSLQLSEIESYERTNYSLTVVAVPGDELLVKIEYDSVRFTEDTIERMLGHLQTIFCAIAENPQQKIGELPLLSTAERQQLLVEWNDTEREYPQDKCIHSLFEEQVERTPDAVAVVFEEQELTYRQLNERANQLAHHLRQLGVQAEVLVGLCLERSIEQLIAVLAILKAGGAYLPLDRNYPSQRLQYLLEDAQVKILLSQQSLIRALSISSQKIICWQTDWSQIAQQPIINPENLTAPKNSAAIFYTSGSTGVPKGVVTIHQGLVNYALTAKNTLGLNNQDRFLQLASIGFDVFLEEILPTWLVGGVVVLPHEAKVITATQLEQIISQQKVTVMEMTTAHWHEWVSQLTSLGMRPPSSLRLLLVGGETILSEYIKQWQQFHLPLVHVYGLTETTITSTMYQLPPDTAPLEMGYKLPIGRPLSNTTLYILDEMLQPVPIGVAGELYIGGDGLARGYLNRPKLTQEKFVPNPFSSDKSARLYKTGDLARYLCDGNIEFLGRIDHQVKIRGFRIEPGEIEAALNNYPQIQQAVVIANADTSGNQRLIAYVVSEEETVNTHQLREFLQQRLPAYMVPAVFVILDTLPLTPNGKIDRKALPAPDPESDRTGEYVAPRTPSEEIIADIFGEVLGIETVGIHDNFFELGGHSLLATQLISRLRQSFEVEIPLKAVFTSPSVAQLDQTIVQLRTEGQSLNLPLIKRIAPDTEKIPLSFAQERLWFLNQLEGASATYNMPAALRLSGRLNLNALQQALAEIIRRHEALRTSFANINGTPMQVIHSTASIDMEVVDLQHLEESERKLVLEQQLQLAAIAAFDLESAPLIRCNLWQLSNSDYVFGINIHHIVSDGWSMGVLIQELSVLYKAFCAGESSPLPNLEIQYADFALWQRQWLSGEILEEQIQYWVSQLQGAPELLQLPTDRPRPSVQSYRGATQSFGLNRELTQKLESLSRRAGSTLFMTLLTAFATLLYRYTGQSDVVIGSAIANRHRSEIEPLIGFFVNTLVLRTRLEDNPSFEQLLAQVRKTTLQAYEHQDVPFEHVVEALQPQRSMSYSPLFQVMFMLQNAPMGELELPGVSLSELEQERTIAKFDLTLDISETSAGLECEWEYNTDLFDRSTIERMASHFENLLSAIVDNPQQRVSELPLLSPAERQLLLVEWNDTEWEYPKDKCIHELFEEQVERTPNAVAVVFEQQQLTYQQLNSRANQLAHYLQTLGVGPEVLVGICVQRSLEMVVGLLGILKAGGAYVPVDPNYPQERLSYMLADSGVEVLLTQENLLSSVPSHTARTVCLDTDWEVISQHSQENLVSSAGADNLAYVIYTSGSTGQPKDVAIEHHSVVNFLNYMSHFPGLTQEDTFYAVTTIAFDIAALELYLPLIVGAKVIVTSHEIATDADRLLSELCESKTTLIQATPATWQMLLAGGWSSNYPLKVLCGGEALSKRLAHQILATGSELWNLYGPTEATIWSTLEQVKVATTEDRPSSIGRPIANTQIYILDRQMEPVPIGVPGELYIGGNGLARGYLNRPELTQERFIPNPFFPDKSARLYKTGDLARYLSDGNIEYIGRYDHQVKIRGFRIELGEIEGTLSQHPDLQQAAVIAREDALGNKHLVAYIVANTEERNLQAQINELQTEYLSDTYLVWQNMYEQSYQQVHRGRDWSFNITGWNSSYTGLPIPDEEMRQWVDYTVQRILELQPKRVLEIGCGMGLLLSKIAPHCYEYWGTDYSKVALQYVEDMRQHVGGLENVTLFHRMADDFQGIEAEVFDTVIINSVIQYFPNITYLLRVIENAVSMVKPGGCIFIGDIRNLLLLEYYHASVQLDQTSDSTSISQLKKRIQQWVTQEEELLIDPAFFADLRQHLPCITQVQIQLKRGTYHNELTKFRYDVILHIDSQVPAASTTEIDCLNWHTEHLTLDKVRQLLESDRPETLGISYVPNGRLQKELQVLNQSDRLETVEQLRQEAILVSNWGVDPEDWWNLSLDLPYSCEIIWSNSGTDESYAVIFQLSSAPKIIDVPPGSLRPWHTYANNPLQGKLTKKLVPQLRQFLETQLPGYMIPSTFKLLEFMPLTPNGKIDRQNLPIPNINQQITVDFVAPRTPIEEILANIWSGILGLEKVGIHDDFFELGGHSLLATQLMVQIREAFSFLVDLPLRLLFEKTTIAELSEFLLNQLMEQTENDLLEKVLEEINR
ncbi:MAG: amino acid adenylation domain-containing protein [Nostoc sp. DedSLP03]|uniref:non-ribosomal peptide synthetase n=1 Tax=Nostoc sp. DedSLP03 TaxID=3075400 RepID=UPI002AD46EF6|nr:non-ribosomal peptide synthetase [Nostoc sp. DedSLP03]MDZ7963735.1 amino acid adenylation domain-containing protein [Nostoc sp. DedSLP03]